MGHPQPPWATCSNESQLSSTRRPEKVVQTKITHPVCSPAQDLQSPRYCSGHQPEQNQKELLISDRSQEQLPAKSQGPTHGPSTLLAASPTYSAEGTFTSTKLTKNPIKKKKNLICWESVGGERFSLSRFKAKTISGALFIPFLYSWQQNKMIWSKQNFWFHSNYEYTFFWWGNIMQISAYVQKLWLLYFLYSRLLEQY